MQRLEWISTPRRAGNRPDRDNCDCDQGKKHDEEDVNQVQLSIPPAISGFSWENNKFRHESPMNFVCNFSGELSGCSVARARTGEGKRAPPRTITARSRPRARPRDHRVVEWLWRKVWILQRARARDQFEYILRPSRVPARTRPSEDAGGRRMGPCARARVTRARR